MRLVHALISHIAFTATANAMHLQCERIQPVVETCPTPADCYYAGSAPFCGAGGNDACKRADEVSCGRSAYGCGAGCWTGWKRLCCRRSCPRRGGANFDEHTGYTLDRSDPRYVEEDEEEEKERRYQCSARHRNSDYLSWTR